ncbi:MAG TPA: hypothetical protein VN420_04650 [Candidatus Fimivivens sp.]|nr:hypothetical protein [Candidatus Fimivivens sp.]
MPGDMFMKDIPSVSPAPTPGKENPFQERPTAHRARIEQNAKVLTDLLVENYLDETFSLEMIKDSLENGNFEIERAYLTHLVSTGVLDHDEENGTYSLNHASPEVQRRIG